MIFWNPWDEWVGNFETCFDSSDDIGDTTGWFGEGSDDIVGDFESFVDMGKGSFNFFEDHDDLDANDDQQDGKDGGNND